MNHDPMCGFHRESGEFDFVADVCARCEFIAKVRIDEREQAAQRIEILGCNDVCGCSITIPNAAAAVRGKV